MALNKQSAQVNFAQGLDTKTDPFQLTLGKFTTLENSIFDKGGLLQKRNGYGALTPLPDLTDKYLTTFSGNLTAIGNTLQAYSMGTEQWVNKGNILPTKVDVLSLIKSSTQQLQADSAIAPNGLICTVYTDDVPVSGTLTPEYKYAIADSVTGQNIVAPILIPAGAGTIAIAPRVFVLGNYFLIMIANNLGGSTHLQYVSIKWSSPTLVSGPIDISSQLTTNPYVNFDGFVLNDTLYIGWNGNDGTVKNAYIDATLGQGNTISIATSEADSITITAEGTGVNRSIYTTWYDSSNNTINMGAATLISASLALKPNFPIVMYTGVPTTPNLASTVTNGIITVLEEQVGSYSYDTLIQNNSIVIQTVTSLGVSSTATTVKNGVGLASKAFVVDGNTYFLSIYFSPLQPSYFLLNTEGQVISQIAYANGGSYYTTGLPSVSLNGNIASMAYLKTDLLQAQSKNTNSPNLSQVYTQKGINQATFTLGGVPITSAEIGNTLLFSGGFLWSYDGYSPVEQGFFLYPDNIALNIITGSGNIGEGTYYYQVTYEWTDNQGNLNRSAPSVPVEAIIAPGSNSVELFIPTLRLTYKINNPVTIVIYRWSVAQQIYYQVTSITDPLINDPTVPFVTYTDTQVDGAILGSNIIYTTGGVIEDISGPATDLITLFDTRLWMVDSEDRNLLWFSKQVIESTPVEMSDLLTFYIAPTTGAQGSTGPITALSAMDDKLIIFKQNAIYYINGTGPDNTGANNQYSQPVFITSTVGCADQNSIVFMPQGLMFQSDKGIWLLGRDLSTQYIGAPVQSYTLGSTVLSAINVPATNQVRFTLDSGVTLMYDYYYGQWGTFVNVPAISSTLFQTLHTYIDQFGRVFQETPGIYLDNSKPVLMNFTTGWVNLAGVQGLQRLYSIYILGVYQSPFVMNMQIGYNYNPSAQQSTQITPANVTPYWGGDPLWGDDQAWGGPGNVFEARIFSNQQKVESFQITMNEQYDNTQGQPAGAGFTLSGMNIIYGGIRGSRLSPASRNFG